MLRQSATETSSSRTRRVVTNSFWLGLDNAFGFLAGIVASIVVARHFGPALLGSYAFISALVLLTGSIAGGSGMGVVTRKLLAEALERGDEARTGVVLRTVWRLQIRIATAAVSLGLIASLLVVEPEHFLVAAFAILSLFPSLMLSVATGANAAVDDFRAITLASIVSSAVNLTGVGVTVLCNGGLEWLALSLLLSRTVDWLVRDGYRRRHFRALLIPRGQTDASEARELGQVRALFAQTAVIQVLDLLVLDRSELFALKYFGSVEQLAFFSIGFGVTRQLDSVGRLVGYASATSLIRRNVQDAQASVEMTHSLMRTIALLVLPALVGMAALSRPFVSVAYGARYLPAVPILSLLGLMGWAGSLVQPVRAYAVARGRQDVMVRAMLGAAMTNVCLALILIPTYGAWGAAWSNGLTQLAGVGLTGWMTSRSLDFHIRWVDLARIAAAAGLMGTIVAGATSQQSSFLALALGPPLGFVAYIVLLRALGSVRREDQARLLTLAERLPGTVRCVVGLVLRFVVR